MRRGTSLTLTALIFILLLLSAGVQIWLLPAAIDRAVEVFPEARSSAGLGIVWGVLTIFCLQVVGVIGLRLVMMPRSRKSTAQTRNWLRAVAGCLLAFLALVVTAFVRLNALEYTSPGVMLGLIAGGLLAVIALASLVVYQGTRPAVLRNSGA